MKIGIDARMLGKGYGLGRYVEELVKHLQEADTMNTYVIFLRKENWDSCHITNKNFTKVLADVPWYSAAEQYELPGILKKEKVDIMHFPHFNVPLLYRGLYVVTIHDLTMFHYPRPEATTHGPFVYWIKDRVHRWVVRSAVKRAEHVITVSEYTKQDIHETFGAPRECMTTTYQAPFENGTATVEDHLVDLKKLGITKPYILYVGAAYPHKNLHRLIDAWKMTKEELGERYQLVLAGKKNTFFERTEEYAQGDPSILFPGFIPDEQLPALYKGAALFVFPSLSEGFGYPPLESFVQGTPVISSNATSLPEVLGEGAYYIDPCSQEQIADAIMRVLADEDLQSQLRQKGRKELKRFSWQQLAKQTIEVYTRCIQASR